MAALYQTDQYIRNHPLLHAEDSPWKIGQILPLVDSFIGYQKKTEVTVLDVGGGAGLILKAVSMYIEGEHNVKVNKIALDLSREMLERQKRENPDLKRALNEDIRRTSLNNKEIDLTLMIDVLEHVPNPEEALEEVRRCSGFVILKVPLEYNLYLQAYNFMKRGKPRQRAIRNIGHVNVFDFRSLKYKIEEHVGLILQYYYCNVFDYYRRSEYYREALRPMDRLLYALASHLYKISPRLSALLVTDFVMIFATCR